MTQNTDQLYSHILSALESDPALDNVCDIFCKLRKETAVYRYEVARAVWQLVDRGLVQVKSGKIGKLL